MTVANATASAHDNAMPAAAWTDEWAHARRCARIGYGSVRARGVAPLAFVEHAARAFQSHVTRGIREAAVACASACKGSQARRRASSGFAAFSRISADRRASRSLLARFFRASRPLLARLFRASPPLLACFALRSAAIRRRSCALRRGAGARCRRTGKMRAFFARHRATRPPGRCREDADRAPRLYRRSYPRYYNPPIAEQ
ncbi:hypothetical protein IST455A_03800 [Burkholderia multivorans]|nr:hypothetical protein IST495A_05705 [Burkholderia multivorans]CAB5306682.1 hypothetical protein IST455A_03800 [Burkholderia multivorans]CAB5308335.1 hypothetical protein IST453_03611 [Burkholderia multivorans]CAB5318334.1 hypothetical protein IST455B_03703 [Burkholderia multivorans]CAB5320718.1 hypothetical protein IST419_03706 [Burkholderia multivorans]